MRRAGYCLGGNDRPLSVIVTYAVIAAFFVFLPISGQGIVAAQEISLIRIIGATWLARYHRLKRFCELVHARYILLTAICAFLALIFPERARSQELIKLEDAGIRLQLESNAGILLLRVSRTTKLNTAPLDLDSFFTENPPRIVINFKTSMHGTRRSYPLQHEFIRSLRYLPLTKNTRIVLDLSDKAQPEFSTTSTEHPAGFIARISFKGGLPQRAAVVETQEPGKKEPEKETSNSNEFHPAEFTLPEAPPVDALVYVTRAFLSPGTSAANSETLTSYIIPEFQDEFSAMPAAEQPTIELEVSGQFLDFEGAPHGDTIFPKFPAEFKEDLKQFSVKEEPKTKFESKQAETQAVAPQQTKTGEADTAGTTIEGTIPDSALLAVERFRKRNKSRTEDERAYLIPERILSPLEPLREAQRFRTEQIQYISTCAGVFAIISVLSLIVNRKKKIRRTDKNHSSRVSQGPTVGGPLSPRTVANKKKQSIASHYKVLGAAESDSDDEIKSKYKHLAKVFHADRLASQDLPPEMIELAKKQFQKIQEAYQALKEDRGIV